MPSVFGVKQKKGHRDLKLNGVFSGNRLMLHISRDLQIKIPFVSSKSQKLVFFSAPAHGASAGVTQDLSLGNSRCFKAVRFGFRHTLFVFHL